MRVLHVIPSISPRRGGPSAVILPMVQALRDRGVEAEVATTDEDIDRLPALPPGLPIRFFPRWPAPARFLREYLYSPRFTSWLNASITDYDVIHTHAIFSHLPTRAMACARHRRIPYVTRPLGQLGVWPLQQSALRKRLYLRLIEAGNLRGASALHLTSTSEREEAGLAGFDLPGVVIPHGLDLPATILDARARLRRELGVLDDTRIVLYLGRLHRKKGIDLLVNALAEMNRPNIVLAIAGDGPERSALARMTEKLGLDRQVRWLGQVEGTRKQICLQGADLFVLTSRHENFGVAVLEALAAGAPVLISDQVALAATLAGNGLGQVAPLDVSAIRAKLAEALADPPCPRLSQRRRDFVRNGYSWASNARALEQLYIDVMQNRARRSGITPPKTDTR
jgi:glycosyltransferase involved in cell wall biosynthesis